LIGGYVLLLLLKKHGKVKVGGLGVLNFKKGYYAYVGSAIGRSISIEKRLERYKRIVLSKTGKLKWHIDYLLADKNVSLVDFIPVKSNMRVECRISKSLSRIADGVVSGFGSSDCKNRCVGHLYYFRVNPKKSILKILEEDGLI
jgi:Uri superfamily endonuclease